LNGQAPQHALEALPADTELALQPKNQAGPAKTESAYMYALTVLYVNQLRHILKIIKKPVTMMTSTGMTQRARYKAYMKIAKTAAQMPVV